MENDLRKRCTFGDLKLDRRAVSAKGLVFGGELSFDLDRERIITLLGEEIYTDGCDFVRELLQNAVDATRVQMVRDRDRNQELHHLPRDALWAWPSEVTSRQDYAIEVNTRSESEAGIPYVVFSIRDRGIGMNPRQIKDYFLQVGKSYYATTQFRKEYSHTPISQFGIGFLSCLTVADRIEVTTRARDEPAGLTLRLNSPSSQFTIIKALEADWGTTVTLWIDPTKPRPEGWDAPPLQDRAIKSHFAFARENFGTAVRQWGLWLEMPVIIDGFAWGPRTASNDTYEFERAHELTGGGSSLSPLHNLVLNQQLNKMTRRFRIQSSSNRLVAEGGITFLAISGLPIVRIEFLGPSESLAYTAGVMGIFVEGSEGHFAPGWVALNFHSGTNRLLSAGRSPRKMVFHQLISPIIDQLTEEVVRQTINELRSRSVSTALYYWSSVSCYSKHSVLEQIKGARLLPYRTRNEKGFAAADELLTRYDRVLLVPPGLAINGPWDLNIPCIGLPAVDYRHRLHDIMFLPLVSLPDLCTAFLYPRDAALGELTPLHERATRIGEDIWVWKEDDREIPRSLLQAQQFSTERFASFRTYLSGDKSTDILRESGAWERYLPDYDKLANVWEELGIDADLTPLDFRKSKATAEAWQYLMNLPLFKWPDDPLVITMSEDQSDQM